MSTQTKEITNINQLSAELMQYYGSENLYHNFLNLNSRYTDGVKAYLELAKAYWLYDIIQTEVFNVLKKKDTPDAYYFKIVAKQGKAYLYLKDYKEVMLWEKKIDFTTHIDGEVFLECGWDGKTMITCLPSEN